MYPSGTDCDSLPLNMAIEIVSFPMNMMVIFHSYHSLPEDTWDISEEKPALGFHRK